MTARRVSHLSSPATTDWIKRVHAAKGNTANTNPNAQPAKYVPSSFPTPTFTPRGYVKVQGGYALASTVLDNRTNKISPVKVARVEKQLSTSKARIQSMPGYRAIPLNKPNWRTGQMSALKWELEPVKTYKDNKIYLDDIRKYYFIRGPENQVAEYQWGHKRLFTKEGKKQTTKYPSWFSKETIDFLKNMGGLTSDPYYTRR